MPVYRHPEGLLSDVSAAVRYRTYHGVVLLLEAVIEADLGMVS
jgi:hypothetical protein